MIVALVLFVVVALVAFRIGYHRGLGVHAQTMDYIIRSND